MAELSEGEQSDGGSAPPAGQRERQLSPQEYREKYHMTVLPGDAPAPCQTFEAAQFSPALLKAVSESIV